MSRDTSSTNIPEDEKHDETDLYHFHCDDSSNEDSGMVPKPRDKSHKTATIVCSLYKVEKLAQVFL